jgi:hypothetical protein
MVEGQTNVDQRAHPESGTETSWVKKYVRAAITEADQEGHIRTHEGVVTRDLGREMEVVNPQPNWAGFGETPWPKYVTKRCHKEGAQEIPVPMVKEKVVEEIREMLDTPI